MATIGGLSNGASSSVNMYGANIKGYGGLASGLDTDSLIEGMTIGTRTKIQEALKQKQNYQWQMDAYRSVSDPLIAFSSKYLNITSSNSPYRTSFFDKSVVTALGANSKYLSVSGASGALDNMSVLGIKQLAKDSSLVTNQNNSIKSLNTGGINFGDAIIESNLEGGELILQLGDYRYSISMTSGDELFGAGANVVPPTYPGETTNKTDFSTAESTANSINAMLKNTKIQGQEEGGTLTLADKVKLSVEGDKFVLKQAFGEDSGIYIGGGSEKALKLMGFMTEAGKLVNEGTIPKGNTGLVGEKDVVTSDPLKNPRDFAEYMGGKTITFNYNGTSRRITFPSKEDIKTYWIDGVTPPADKAEGMKAMAGYLNAELGQAFGTGKVSVMVNTGTTPSSLSFTTPDSSSILRITDADAGIMSEKGVFGISYSTTNRLSAEVPLAKSGINIFGGTGLPGEVDADGNPTNSGKKFGDYTFDSTGKKVYTVTNYNDAEGNLYININGKEISGLKVDSSLKQIMTAINDSSAGVKMSYNETADRISFMSTNHGEAGKIDLSAAGGTKTDLTDPDNPTQVPDPHQKNFLHLITGSNSSDYTYIQGQDAIMTVKYEGNVETDIKRDSNSFKLDGSTFTLNNTFGFDGRLVGVDGSDAPAFFDKKGKPIAEQIKMGPNGTFVPELYIKDSGGTLVLMPPMLEPDGVTPSLPEGVTLYNYQNDVPIDGTEAITFTSAVDTEKVTKVISAMVEDYNTMADLINKLTSTKPDRDYGPLTDDEKAQLNQDQIKMLEDKAKEGILFNDTLLRSLAEKMRSVFSGTADVGTLKSMGLNLSNSYKDNGKVSFDEETFKNALLENPEKVKKLFTEPPTINSNGEIERAGGISVRLKAIADDFASVSGYRKGSLIEKAGSIASPTSVLQNSLKKLMDSIDVDVKKLKDKLKIEVDRYTKQFSSLEQLISQMNSQSSWFSQATGG